MLENPTLIDETHLIGNVACEPHFVRRDNHRHADVLQPTDDGDALLFAAAEAIREFNDFVRNAETSEEVVRRSLGYLQLDWALSMRAVCRQEIASEGLTTRPSSEISSEWRGIRSNHAGPVTSQ